MSDAPQLTPADVERKSALIMKGLAANGFPVEDVASMAAFLMNSSGDPAMRDAVKAGMNRGAAEHRVEAQQRAAAAPAPAPPQVPGFPPGAGSGLAHPLVQQLLKQQQQPRAPHPIVQRMRDAIMERLARSLLPSSGGPTGG